MKLCVRIGIPMLIIIGPINCFFGGNAAGEDHLSYLSFGNIENGSNLYWLHSVVIWCVTISVRNAVFKGMQDFLARRVKWLRNLPEIRSNTVLVESIPEKYQTEKALADFWKKILPHARIKSSYVAKDTAALLRLIADREAATMKLQEVEAIFSSSGQRPTVSESYFGKRIDAIEYHRAKVSD